MRWVLSILGALTLLGASYAVAVWLGAFGRAERGGAPTEVHRPVPLVQAGVEAQRRAAQSLEEASDKQIRRFRLAWSCLSFVATFTLGREGVHNAEESSPVPSGATS